MTQSNDDLHEKVYLIVKENGDKLIENFLNDPSKLESDINFYSRKAAVEIMKVYQRTDKDVNRVFEIAEENYTEMMEDLKKCLLDNCQVIY